MFRILYYNKYNLFFIIFALFFGNSLFAQSNARDYLNNAKKLYANFEYFAATGALQKALQINPYYTEAQILLGDSYFAMGNFNAAWEIYLTAEQKTPNNPDLLIKLASTKLKLAKTREEILATEYYLKKAYKLEPRNSSIAAVYGEFYIKTNDYDRALSYYNNLGNVDDTNVYINKAKVYETWGQDENALKELQKAEKLDSKNYLVLLELGKTYSRLNENDKAMVYLNTAYSYNNKNRAILEALAEIYMKDNNYTEASQKISQLILDDSSNPILYYNLALCYEALGDFIKAIEILQQGLEFDYGNEFLRIKAEEIAISKLPLTDPIRNKLAGFYTTTAANLLKNNQEDSGLFFLKRALRINPLNVKIRMDIAYIYRKRSFLYEYLKLLQGGLFLAPQNTSLKDQLQLNQKFIFNSLEAKEKLNPKPFIELEPVIRIQDVRIEDKNYNLFNAEAKEVFLETLMNKHSINAFIASNDVHRKGQFDIRFALKPFLEKVEVSLEVIYVPTGETYKSYNITEYGNNRIIHAFERLSNYIEQDIPKIARILKIDGNTAIINMGAQQGIKLGQSLSILNNPDLPNKFFSIKTIDPAWEIASAKVIELGENISKINFKPLDRIVFNMVQQNQSIIIESMKNDNKKKTN